jgi:hypothetical protein
MRQFGSGGDNAPILLVVGNGRQQVPAASAIPVVQAVDEAAPGARVVSYAAQRSLLAADGRTGVVMVYPHPVPGADAYAAASCCRSKPFGFSMDHEVFLLTRIREEHDHGHDTDDATRLGVARTGRLITSAALILFLDVANLPACLPRLTSTIPAHDDR